MRVHKKTITRVESGAWRQTIAEMCPYLFLNTHETFYSSELGSIRLITSLTLQHVLSEQEGSVRIR